MKNKTTVIHILLILLAAALLQVFCVLCALLLRPLAEWAFWLALLAGTATDLLLTAADIIFYIKGKKVVYKSCVLALLLLIFSAIVMYILLKTGFLEIARDEERLQEYLRRTGGWMSALFVLLQFLQVVVLPIPSTVTVVAGAALFGPLKGSFLSLLGIVLGSLVAFLVGRYAGSRVVAWIIGKETLDKWLKRIKGKDKLLLSAMFLLPVFPDDVLCFVAGLSSMSLPLFFGVILLSRVLAIFTTSYSVTIIPFNTWWGLLIWGVLLVLIAVLFVVLYKRSDDILLWFEKKFHRETRVEQKPKSGEFTLEVVDPDGAIVSKGVARKDSPPSMENKR